MENNQENQEQQLEQESKKIQTRATVKGKAQSKPKPKYYAVVLGRQPGVFSTWSDCHKSVDGYSHNLFVGVESIGEAIVFLDQNGVTHDDENMIQATMEKEGKYVINTQNKIGKNSEEKEKEKEKQNPNNNKENAGDQNCEYCTKQNNESMIKCGNCMMWVHYECTGLPAYQLTMLTGTNRKFDCENCVNVDDEIEQILNDKTQESEELLDMQEQIIVLTCDKREIELRLKELKEEAKEKEIENSKYKEEKNIWKMEEERINVQITSIKNENKILRMRILDLEKEAKDNETKMNIEELQRIKKEKDEKDKEIKALKKNAKDMAAGREINCAKIIELEKKNEILNLAVKEMAKSSMDMEEVSIEIESKHKNTSEEPDKKSQGKREYEEEHDKKHKEQTIKKEVNDKGITKNRICKYFMRNQCKFNEKCRFIHPQPQGVSNTWNRKSMVCVQFNRGECYRENCKYLHVRKLNGECRNFQQNKCRFGEYCKFKHTTGNGRRRSYENETNANNQELNNDKWKSNEQDQPNGVENIISEIAQLKTAISNIATQTQNQINNMQVQMAKGENYQINSRQWVQYPDQGQYVQNATSTPNVATINYQPDQGQYVQTTTSTPNVATINYDQYRWEQNNYRTPTTPPSMN